MVKYSFMVVYNYCVLCYGPTHSSYIMTPSVSCVKRYEARTHTHTHTMDGGEEGVDEVLIEILILTHLIDT